MLIHRLIFSKNFYSSHNQSFKMNFECLLTNTFSIDRIQFNSHKKKRNDVQKNCAQLHNQTFSLFSNGFLQNKPIEFVCSVKKIWWSQNIETVHQHGEKYVTFKIRSLLYENVCAVWNAAAAWKSEKIAVVDSMLFESILSRWIGGASKILAKMKWQKLRELTTRYAKYIRFVWIVCSYI